MEKETEQKNKEESKNKIEPKNKAEAKSKTEPKNKVEAKSKTEPKNKVEAKSKTDSKNKTEAKKTTTVKTTKKVSAKSVPVQKKTVTKKAEEHEKKEKIIEQVENVSEQAQVYEDLVEHNLIDDKDEVNEKLIDPKVFKDNELETIRKELNNNKKISKSKGNKQEKYKEIFKNSLIFIFIELYFLILLIGQYTIGTIEYITNLKIFILVELVVSIILFEISYKKENSKLAWHGIEMVLLGASTVLILYLYSRQSNIINTVFAIIAGAFLIYYIVKMIVIMLKKKKN